jgi:competence protein ComEA
MPGALATLAWEARLRRGFGAVALLLAFSLPAAGQDPFPEGPGKDVTVRMCGTCHPSARGAAVRLTREGWQDVIAKMVSLGAKGTDAELATVLDYLSTNFKGDAPKPVNMNTAPAIDLESVAGLLRKEAAALIAYRTRHGPCKTLDDLKNIPGVDFRKINRRRDRLVCF